MSVITQASITDLESLIEGLPGEARGIAARLLAVSSVTGVLDAPPEMHEWIAKFFGSVEAVREQRIVRVTNRVTYEGALFNELRAKRPMEAKGGAEAQETIAKAAGDPFCLPLTGTPSDVFGRITGTHAITASNIAKYDGFHGVLVFAEHDPLAETDASVIRDHLSTGRQWAEAAIDEDPAARYYFLMWNSLWRAGGSIVHAHMQMTATRGMHYPKIELLRRQATEYDERYQHDYFDDLWAVHEALGLTTEVEGARVLASLTPIKEREVIVLGRPGESELALAPAIARVLAAYRRMGVLAFNMACYMPPLSADGTDWRRFPPVVRMVDRGDTGNRTSDFGAMELYAASVISTDPFRVAEAFRS